MTVTRATLIAAIRAGVFAACPDLVAEPDEPTDPLQVIVGPVRKGGTRPGLPYLLITFQADDDPIGEDDDVEGTNATDPDDPDEFEAAAPTRYVEGGRSAEFTIQAFGDGSDAYLRKFAIGLNRDSVEAAILAVAPVDILANGGIQDVPATLGTSTERRYVRSFGMVYRDATEPDTLAEARGVVGVTYPRTDGEASPPALANTTIVPRSGG